MLCKIYLIYKSINFSGKAYICQLTIEPMIVLRRYTFCLQYENTEYKTTRSL